MIEIISPRRFERFTAEELREIRAALLTRVSDGLYFEEDVVQASQLEGEISDELGERFNERQES